jgi:hypothetical protein
MVDRVARACERARSRQDGISTDPTQASPERWVAMGDPQAPLEKVFGILDAHGLLGDDGRLSPQFGLVSLGDHFDWGGAREAERASADGLALLSWLLGHAPNQVRVIVGNHDLGRLGELAAFDDDTFRIVRAKALVAHESDDESLERALLAEHPQLPTAELAARDFAAFSVAQRTLIRDALRIGRMVAAYAHEQDVLLMHAGITCADLELVGSPTTAHEIASALNAALTSALTDEPLRIEGLHEPGNAALGEGGGIFYHRATSLPVVRGPLRRRFDARTIPSGITQVIGHVGDEKSRELMPEWSSGEPADGRLRTLVLDDQPAYRTGVHVGETRIVFADGGMNRRSIDRYELLDLTEMKPLTPIGR